MADEKRSIYVDEPMTTGDTQSFVDQPMAPPRSWTDTAVDSLPAIGGAVGGALGAATGIPSMGLTSVPAAVAGASILGAGGEAVRQLINRYRGVEAPSTPAQAAGDIALQGGEQGALEAGGAAATTALSAGGRAVYRGYLKPSLSRVNLPKAKQIVETAIQEYLPVTEGGAARARQVIGELNAKVDSILSNMTGRTVNLSDVANEVRAWAQRRFNRAGNDPANLQAALKVADRIDQHPSVQNPFNPSQPATADLLTANTIKKDVQGDVRDRFGVPGGSAETQTEKVASAKLRQAIEQQAPEVGPLNAREGRLLDVARSINQAIGRNANQDKLIGTKMLFSGVVGAGEYGRTKNPAQALTEAMATRALLSPAVATRAAIIAAKLGDAMPGAAVADLARVAIRAASEANQPGGEGQ